LFAAEGGSVNSQALDQPGAPQPAGQRQRFHYLDGIRAFAALYVVAHHIWLTVYPGFPENSSPSWTKVFMYGHLAVAVFIVVSGFSLMVVPAKNGHTLVGGNAEFFRRRAWRILPPYWMALIASFLVLVLVRHEHAPARVWGKTLLVHSALMQNLVGNRTVNGAFWSIAVEFQIYLLFPILLLVWRRRSAVWATALAAVLVVVSQELSVHVETLHPFTRLTLQFYALFALGALAADVVVRARARGEHPRHGRWLMAVAGAAGAALVVITALFGGSIVARNFFWADLLVGVAMACLLVALADGRPRRVTRTLESRPAVSVGGFSYSVYLMHIPIVLILWTWLVSRLDLGQLPSFLILLVVGMALVVPCSWLFSQVFEQPFLRIRSFSQLRASLRHAQEKLPAMGANVTSSVPATTDIAGDSLSMEGAPPA
jgi:peptidoglycan/LPS O-acetylase OafA/YrhL